MLPEPAPALKTHSHTLSADIARRITAHGGWLGFDEYMNCALYAAAGYYRGGLVKFGGGGDFITAPALGATLGRCLGRQCAEILAQTGGDIIEFGAGDGRLAADLLLALDEFGQLPTRYLIMETSAELRARQAATIARRGPPLRARVRWLRQLPAGGFSGVALANEVLDAMPVTRFEVDADGVPRLLGVALADESGANSPPTFRWQAGPPLPDALRRRLPALPPGYRSEIAQAAEAWTRTVAAALNHGALLLIDYGFPRAEFYHPERRDGTLMCHYRHRAHADPFFHPGLQDISTHLDFTAIAEAAVHAELAPAGFASQAAFLLALGALDDLAAAQTLAEAGAEAESARKMAQQIKTLTLPHEMGELFKVAAFTRRYAEPLRGFSLQDRRAAIAVAADSATD